MSIDPQTRLAIREAFHRGELRVRAVDLDTGEVALHPVTDVLKHTHVSHKRALRVRTSAGVSGAGGLEAGFREVVTTEDHSLFRFDQGWLRAVPASDLRVGEWIAAVTPPEWEKGCPAVPTLDQENLGPDIPSPESQCFGEHLVVPEGTGQTTAARTQCTCLPTTGKLWPSQVLEITEVDRHEVMYDLSVPGPQNFVLTNGLLAHNSYSIGGISLDINKASVYESLKQNAEQQFDKGTESKQSTVKVIRGLKQSRFGMGVRSAFGPFTGRGSLGPRSFV